MRYSRSCCLATLYVVLCMFLELTLKHVWGCGLLGADSTGSHKNSFRDLDAHTLYLHKRNLAES